jgi:hypothetical protein
MTRNELYEIEGDIVVKTIDRIKKEQAEYVKGVEYGMDLAFRAVRNHLLKEEEDNYKARVKTKESEGN